MVGHTSLLHRGNWIRRKNHQPLSRRKQLATTMKTASSLPQVYIYLRISIFSNLFFPMPLKYSVFPTSCHAVEERTLKNCLGPWAPAQALLIQLHQPLNQVRGDQKTTFNNDMQVTAFIETWLTPHGLGSNVLATEYTDIEQVTLEGLSRT